MIDMYNRLWVNNCWEFFSAKNSRKLKDSLSQLVCCDRSPETPKWLTLKGLLLLAKFTKHSVCSWKVKDPSRAYHAWMKMKVKKTSQNTGTWWDSLNFWSAVSQLPQLSHWVVATGIQEARVLHLSKFLNCPVHIGPESGAALATGLRLHQMLDCQLSTQNSCWFRTWHRHQHKEFTHSNLSELLIRGCQARSQPVESHPLSWVPATLATANQKSDSQMPQSQHHITTTHSSWNDHPDSTLLQHIVQCGSKLYKYWTQKYWWLHIGLLCNFKQQHKMTKTISPVVPPVLTHNQQRNVPTGPRASSFIGADDGWYCTMASSASTWRKGWQ